MQRPELAAEGTFGLKLKRLAAHNEVDRIVGDWTASMTRDELMQQLESSGLPFAPIAKPEDLLDDPHLNESGGLLEMTLPDGKAVRLPAMPFEMDGHRFGARLDPPRSGEHSEQILGELGYDGEAIQSLIEGGAVSGEGI